jgi:hypothetical protein
MPESSREISRDTLERLVTRALESDEGDVERISLTKAREIARDLGISDAAWAAALAEDDSGLVTAANAEPRKWSHLRTALTAGLGFAAGAGGGWLNAEFRGDLDVAYAALLVAVGVLLSVRARRESAEAAQASLDAWWVAIPAGMMAAFGGLRTDPLLFAALARWGTGWVTEHLPRLFRFFPQSERSRTLTEHRTPC